MNKIILHIGRINTDINVCSLNFIVLENLMLQDLFNKLDKRSVPGSMLATQMILMKILTQEKDTHIVEMN